MTGHSTAAPLARLGVQPQSVPPAARRAAHSISVSTGRLTHWARMTPGFLIVGAQRGGTTSMYRTLSQHPAILKAVLHKGVHYFDTGYEHGPAWYRGHFPLRAKAARVQRATGEQPLTFESSPYYMFHPLAAQRISRDLPGVKLLVLVRDPVERAYSAHAHELARAYETEPFERALELEDARLDGEAERIISQPTYHSHSHQHHAYLTRGRYAEQLERLAGLFGRERLHVVDSGLFFTDPEPVYDGVLDFLGLRQHGYPAFERHNARPRSPMPETLRSRLDEHFRPHDERLADWLGHTPSWRTGPPAPVPD
ncbi:MAG: sulfotransferase [Streptosporangiaceae bacterium]